jgi:hypothetical protein
MNSLWKVSASLLGFFFDGFQTSRIIFVLFTFHFTHNAFGFCARVLLPFRIMAWLWSAELFFQALLALQIVIFWNVFFRLPPFPGIRTD